VAAKAMEYTTTAAPLWEAMYQIMWFGWHNIFNSRSRLCHSMRLRSVCGWQWPQSHVAVIVACMYCVE